MKCANAGRKNLTDIDIYYRYKEGFKEGSTRMAVWKNLHREATIEGLLPSHAAERLRLVKDTLRTYIYETEMQKTVRIEHEFSYMTQGNLTHAEFSALLSKIDGHENLS